MEKGTLRLLALCLLVSLSRQRPQQQQQPDASDDDAAPTTTEAAAATTEIATEETATEQDRGPGTTEATAVSAQTTVNVSRFEPGHPTLGGFRPSGHYYRDRVRHEELLALRNPGPPPVVHGAFREPPRRPAAAALDPFPEQPDVVFPPAALQASQTAGYSEHKVRPGDGPAVKPPDFQGPHKPFVGTLPQHKPFVGTLPQHKPIRHDYGGDAFRPDLSAAFDGGGQGPFGGKGPFGGEGPFGGGEGPFGGAAHQTNERPYRYGVVTRKKKDPWRSVLSVLATILPVGLLLASFPPTVIKVNSSQHPYQFQKNSTAYNPNVVTGRFRALSMKNAGRRINEENTFPDYSDDCLKKKICENIKTNHSPSEWTSVLQNSKLNLTDNSNYGPMVEIAKAAASTLPESCQVFVCDERT